MKKVLIFSGTTEGKQLAGILTMSGVVCHVCVATKYGKQVMDDNPNQVVFTGRLEADDMRKMYEDNKYDAVIDATHPFADVVTANIKKSLIGTDIPYFRLSRNTDDDNEGQIICDDIEDVIAKLKDTTGNILLTTGSKSLHMFCEDEQLRSRLYVRILPGADNIAICEKCGIRGERIIAMQGPFGVQLNEAIIRQFNIENLVTKESGSNGGFHEKLEAAANAKIKCFVIKNPEKKNIEDYNPSSVSDICHAIGINYNPKIHVTIAGIGMGSMQLMTKQVTDVLKHADYVFGAKRMIESVKTPAVTYPYYLAKDIVPMLQEKYEKEQKSIKAVVLFSGDSGFFSGSERLKESLSSLQNVTVDIMPGISSLSALSAKTGISWQDACIKTTHGVDSKEWLFDVTDTVEHNKKTFIITSGGNDIVLLLEKLSKLKCNPVLYVGTNISYEDESIEVISADEYFNNKSQYDKSYGFEDSHGLVSAFIINDNPVKRQLTPGFKDSEFIRRSKERSGIVPMTKEDIRHLSVCRLSLNDDSIVYDIGGGTGSVSVEIAALSPKIKVYSIEVNAESALLIKDNAAKFGLDNIEVINDSAPECLSNLPVPDCVFIGGTKGNIVEILKVLYEKRKALKERQMSVVINAMTLESVTQINDALKNFDIYDDEVTYVQVSKSKKIGGYTMMMACNGIYIFSFRFGKSTGAYNE